MKFLKIVISLIPVIFFTACDEDDYDAEAQLKKTLHSLKLLLKID